eukprot:TRINITY_DN5730_c0_g1_i3.p1 TRINITY_DN5730_c0_g1~~TRINITY_DN5730_c0_g1_i3.p1  ORF type:complete len:122 (+),score=11.41 TRINITY_DN5730_c0_g1_i3:180-545(+)
MTCTKAATYSSPPFFFPFFLELSQQPSHRSLRDDDIPIPFSLFPTPLFNIPYLLPRETEKKKKKKKKKKTTMGRDCKYFFVFFFLSFILSPPSPLLPSIYFGISSFSFSSGQNGFSEGVGR